MSYSLNETEALCRKAARGAGYSWGLAEEAGKAVRWLVSVGLPGCEVLADLLSQVDGEDLTKFTPMVKDGEWFAAGMCPLIGGAALSDFADQIGDAGVTLQNVMQPVLLLPFLRNAAAAQNLRLAVEWDGSRYVTDGIGLRGATESAAACAAVRCFITRESVDIPAPSVQRADPDAGALKTLGTLAHRTYAPATEASRLLGAG